VTLDELLNYLAAERSLDLRGYKHTTLERRLRRRMGQLSIGSYENYLDYVRTNPDESKLLLDAILINVTEFFRDPAAWDVLAEDVLPALFKNIRTGGSFRAWVAGCATGEEVYSLAILLAEHFGQSFGDYDIKIYATDVDESALTIARRGEYPLERLRRVRPEWRAKYFTNEPIPRFVRDIRRMLIFGRSDVVHDAPISHVQILLCRNVLIYFDSLTQKHILNRLHYALDPGGVLFLGKSESKLSESVLFRPINSRWRIFRRLPLEESDLRPHRREEQVTTEEVPSQSAQELETLRLYYGVLLETLEPGVIALDTRNVMVNENESALKLWGLSGMKLIGKNIEESPLATRCPELIVRLRESRNAGDKTLKFYYAMNNGDEPGTLQITIRPVLAPNASRVGTLVCAEDVSHRGKLQNTIEQLEATSEELQSANEELETTNEELQSTNEELETTNEELQSTNEELETTNEELQSLNEELENMNEELEFRTRELDNVNNRYAETLERMPWAVTVLDHNGKVQFWNSAAEKLFNLYGAAVIGFQLAQLPIQPSLRQPLLRRLRAVTEKKKASVLRDQEFNSGRGATNVDIHFTPLSRNESSLSVLLMFSPVQGNPGKSESSNNKSAKRTPAKKKLKMKKR
jgi:two-component system, chemotaxis family, CheB/CheR fusion protein